MGALALQAGCGAPISNAVFLEDAAFLEALPSGERFGPPEALREATVTDARWLAAAAGAAAAYDDATRWLAGAGTALRRATPAERSDVHRGWEATPVVVASGTEGAIVWVRGRVLRPDGQGATWTLELADEPDGPWRVVGAGWHEGGVGSASWGDDDVSLRVDYDEAAPSQLAEREGARWEVDGERFGFVPTGEGLPAGEGWLWAVHGASGGRAEGEDAEGARLAGCWGAQGESLWEAAYGELPASGDEAACPVAAP